MTDKIDTRFKAGQSGNPGGRPKVIAVVQELARKHTEAAFKELVRLAFNAESETVRVAAIKEILDRGYGKAPQALTGEGGEGPVAVNLVVEFVGAGARMSVAA